jgi:hypothetical protein
VEVSDFQPRKVISNPAMITVNHEIFAVLKVGKFAFFQLAVDRNLMVNASELKFVRVLCLCLTVHSHLQYQYFLKEYAEYPPEYLIFIGRGLVSERVIILIVCFRKC